MLCDGNDSVPKRTPKSCHDADDALFSDFLKGWRESVRCYAIATTAYLNVLLGAIATQMALYPTDLSEQTADYTIIRNINLLCCWNLRQTGHSHNITGQNYDKAGACCNAAVADSNLEAAWAT